MPKTKKRAVAGSPSPTPAAESELVIQADGRASLHIHIERPGLALVVEELSKYVDGLTGFMKHNANTPQSPAQSRSPIKRNGKRGVSKIDLVFRLVSGEPKRGVTPTEIKEMSKSYGIENGSNSYPYVMLWKLKKTGDIIERDGRYYPAASQ